MSRRSLAWTALLLGLLQACNCNTQKKIIHAPEDYKIVPGTPAVRPDTPQVLMDTQPPPYVYAPNVPRQCDLFAQNTVRKVDIMWVVDGSDSMGDKQQQLADNFQSFITYLLSADPPIDFHIGVVSNDTDNPNESGRLHGWADTQGNQGSYISCDQNHNCNTAPNAGGADPSQTVQDAFAQMALVGTKGSGNEHGLYASYLALTRDDNIDHNDGNGGFIRSDAALYVVYVGDEDDMSCAPMLERPDPAVPGDACTNDPLCHCPDDSQLIAGKTSFYIDFLKNYKGFGHSDLVAAAAIVATDKFPENSSYDTFPHIGCNSNTPDPITGRVRVAFYGRRFIAVANATGGVATSICSSNFNNALTNLGFAVSGLRRDFKLSRGPDATSLSVFIAPRDATPCGSDAECIGFPPYTSCQYGKCSRSVPVSLQPDDNASQYIRCQNGGLRNVVSFGTQTIPPALGTVEVCYNVDAHFDQNCP